MSDNFFSRWSRRKQGVDTSEPVQAEPVKLAQVVKPAVQGAPTLAAASASLSSSPAAHAAGQPATPTEPAPLPVPTMDDVQQLTPSSDFQGYMRQGVPGEVRNAAMKKLFTDPHFNVMDGLDIYIGDYNTPDPLPPGMLEKMVGAELLNLFPKKAQELPPDGSKAVSTEASQTTGQSPDAADGAAVVAKSPPSPDSLALPHSTELQASAPPLASPFAAHSASPLALPEHDDPDLQLQPNHAPASPSPGQSTG
jgi:hypothetical protein